MKWALLVLTMLNARFACAQEPVIHRLYWQPDYYKRHWAFEFEVVADSNGAAWTARGKWGKASIFREVNWTLAGWNAMAVGLQAEGSKVRHDPSFHYHGACVLQINSGPRLLFESESDSHFEAEVQASPIGDIERDMESQARAKEQSQWLTRTYHLKLGRADKICGYLQGQYKELEFTMLSLYRFQAFGPPDQFPSLEADIRNLDRGPETAP